MPEKSYDKNKIIEAKYMVDQYSLGNAMQNRLRRSSSDNNKRWGGGRSDVLRPNPLFDKCTPSEWHDLRNDSFR
jgi:hypothetical protein